MYQLFMVIGVIQHGTRSHDLPRTASILPLSYNCRSLMLLLLCVTVKATDGFSLDSCSSLSKDFTIITLLINDNSFILTNQASNIVCTKLRCKVTLAYQFPFNVGSSMAQVKPYFKATTTLKFSPMSGHFDLESCVY